MSARVVLSPLDPKGYARRMEGLVDEYARDHTKTGRWTAEEAPRRAREETAYLLPNGQATKDHFFVGIREAKGHLEVGWIWWSIRTDEGPPSAFIWSIAVDAPFRRMGFAKAALEALTEVVRLKGLHTLRLHVFGDNLAARQLYEATGFRITDLLMAKDL